MIAMLRPAGLFFFSLVFAATAFGAGSPASGIATTAAGIPEAASAGGGSGAIATDSFLFLPNETLASSPLQSVQDPLTTTLSVMTSLALVVGLIFAVSWFLQKRHGLSGTACGRTLGVLPIDGRRFISIVDVMGRVLVLGVTEHHISLLCEITDRALIDSLRIQPGGTPTIPGLEKVFAFLKRNSAKPADPEGAPPPDVEDDTSFAEHTRKAQERIRKMEDLIIRRSEPGDSDRV